MEEKKEETSAKWPVEWANTSKRLAKIGWCAVLLTLTLFAIFGTTMESLNMQRPNWVEQTFGIFLAILFWGTVLCFLLSLITGITSLFASFFKVVSFKDIRRNALRGFSFSLIYFSILLVLMTPPILRRIKSKYIICKRNLIKISIEMEVCSELITHNWCDVLKDNTAFDTDILRCNYDKTGPCSYAMNENIPADANDLPGDLVLLFESAPGWNQVGGPDDVITDRHGQPGANIAFADGHVEFVEADKIPALRWTLNVKD